MYLPRRFPALRTKKAEMLDTRRRYGEFRHASKSSNAGGTLHSAFAWQARRPPIVQYRAMVANPSHVNLTQERGLNL